MKSPIFLSTVLIAVLVVLAVSCTPMQGAQDEYERPTAGRRVIVEDPYYNNTTYLVRDPYTGMYYEVRPYGYSPYDSYGYNYGSPYYNNRYYRGYPSDRRSGGETRQQPTGDSHKSRESVLGKH